MADKKTTWLIRPASPDALSKKLKKCKTRKERQMAVFNDNLEKREERRRMERATMEAEQAAKQAQLDAELAFLKETTVEFILTNFTNAIPFVTLFVI